MFFPKLHLLLFVYLSSCKSDECPTSFRQCHCSNDLTIISCVNRQLTDRFLRDFATEIPRQTIVLNLSSNIFTSISNLPSLTQLETLDLSRNQLQTIPSNLFSKYPQLSSLFLQSNSLRTIPKSFNEISNIQFDLSSNPLNCQCSMKWLVKWFETIRSRRPISCQRSTKLTEEDFCSNQRDFLEIFPSQSQLVYENDSLTLNCSSNLKIFWTLNNEFYSSNSIVRFDRLKLNDSGRWTCHNSYRNRSIDVHVLKIRSQHFCPSVHLETSKGHFSWPRTLTGQTIQLKCPFGGAAWTREHLEQFNAFYTCSIHRQWTDLDLSQCAFRTNISREFDRIVAQNQTNLLAKLVTFVSQTNLNDFQFDDVVFLIDLIDEEQEKYRQSRQMIDEISTFIFRLTDSILQIEENRFIGPQYENALTRLRLIVEDLFQLSNRSWFYVGKQITAMTLESPTSPAACFVPHRPLLTIICGILNRQTKRHELRLATIEFPSSSIYRILLYRQAKLFSIDSKQRNDHPIISIQPVSSTNVSNVKLTFYSQSNQAAIASWNSNGTLWQIKPSFCRISQQNLDLIETNCSIESNQSIIMTYLSMNYDERSLFLNENYLELAVIVSSIIGSICFFLSIFFYICYHKVYLMPRSFFHCLINYWFSLGIVFPLFAFGIRQSDYLLVCQFISVLLHYLCLTTIIWLTLLSYCIWQKLYMIWSGKGHSDDDDGQPASKSVMIVDYDDDGLPIMKIRSKPVIQFYFLAYGISFIICGINVAISREQYISNKICFLNNFESLLTVLIPIGIFTFLSLIFLVAARLNISRLRKEAIRLRDLPDENENELNVQQDENLVSSKPNETLPIIYPSESNENHPALDCRQSHLDSLCSSDMDHQHEPTNQLLAILFQNILLIVIFLSSLSIYFHPLRSYSWRFEHSIYNHLYGFFVLLLSFFVLAFYVLSRADLTLHCKYTNICSNRSKKRRLLDQSYNEPPPPPQTPQQSPPPTTKDSIDAKILFNPNLNADDSFNEQIVAPSPPHSIHSSTIYNCQTAGQSNSDRTQFGSKYQTQLASKYYARHRHLLKTNTSASETSLPANDFQQMNNMKSIESQDETQKLIQPIPIETSSRVRRNEYSPSQAIIRPLPIVRLSSPMIEQRQPTIVYLNKNSDLIHQQVQEEVEEKHPHAHVAFIDDDEEGSVSLKSSTATSTSSTTTTPSIKRRDRSKSLSSSSSSSSSTFSNNFQQRESIDTNELVLHESSV